MRADAADLQPYAWAVEFGKGLRALFLDHAKAVEYAARSHGVVVPLYDHPPET